MKHALRSLYKSPGFTLTALVTLALGIGVNTSMFTILNAVMLRQLPYADADRLVRVYRTSPQSRAWPHAPANFLDHQAQNGVFDGMAAMQWMNFSFSEPGQPAERLRGILVTGDFFRVLGVQPQAGRVFGREEDQPGKNNVVVLGHALWVNRFARDPALVGRTLRMNGEPVTVIGVMPPGFEDRMSWGNIQLWRPMAFTAEQRAVRNSNYLETIARLKPGVTEEQAQAAMTTLATQLAQTHPVSNTESGLRMLPLASGADEMSAQLTWFVIGLGGFVLLIACANLANLQFARTAGRAREYAIRTALGATRFRLIREVLAESLGLGVVGGAAGLLLAVWCNDLLGRNIIVANQPGLPLPLDLRVLGFALFASVGTGLAFGLLPAVFASRAKISDALKQGGRGTSASRAQHRLRHALIVAEVALALVLLAGAGFFIRGLQRFSGREVGWQPDGVLTGYVALPANKYGDDDQRRAFADRFQEALAALPGAQRAALASSLPTWTYGGSGNLIVEGRPVPERGREPLFLMNNVSPGFFETLGMRLVAGRHFTAADRGDSPRVIIISENTARTLWPGESALGKRLGAPGETPNWREVVGVVNDIRSPADLGVPDSPFATYRPMAQVPVGYLTFALRTAVPPETLANAVRQAVAAIDPDQPVHDIATVRTEIARQLDNFSIVKWLLGSFASLGLVLAAVGIYGVIAGFVVQRTNEIGIRLALGAQLRDILALVLGKGLRLVALGVLLGLGGAYAIARLLMAILPEVPAAESYTTLIVTAVLVGIATFACWLPARRATKVDPISALRSE